MIVKLAPKVYKILKKADVKVRKSFKHTILIFSKNPYDSSLNNHTLRNKYDGYRSIDITADWRGIYEEVKEGESVIAYFIDLGTHDQLHK